MTEPEAADNDTRPLCRVIPLSRAAPPPPSPAERAPRPRSRSRSGVFLITSRGVLAEVIRECVDEALEAYEAASAAQDAQDAADIIAAARGLVESIAETFGEIEALP